MSLIRKILLWVGVAVFLLPVAFILTLLSFPFWRWIEETYHVESFGHSGPAEWCYWVVYATSLTVVIAGVLNRRSRPSGSD